MLGRSEYLRKSLGSYLPQRCPWLPVGISLGTCLSAGIWVTDCGKVTSNKTEKTAEVILVVVMGVGAIPFGLLNSQKQEVPPSGVRGCAEWEAPG